MILLEFFFTGKVLGAAIIFQVTNDLELSGKISYNFFLEISGNLTLFPGKEKIS